MGDVTHQESPMEELPALFIRIGWEVAKWLVAKGEDQWVGRTPGEKWQGLEGTVRAEMPTTGAQHKAESSTGKGTEFQQNHSFVMFCF